MSKAAVQMLKSEGLPDVRGQVMADQRQPAGDRRPAANDPSKSGIDAGSIALGADIRALRRSRGMTLNALAACVERSIGWLSQVERGQSTPSIPDLKALAKAFDVPLSLFFRNADAPAEEQGTVVRREARAAVGSAEDGLSEELLSPSLSGSFEMIRSVFMPGAERAVMPARKTEDGGYLVRGALELTVGDKTFQLSAGDSFQFNGQPYGWANRSSQVAEVIWIISPPTY